MPDPLGDLSFTWPFYAAAVLGYLLGSIPFGLVLTTVAGLGDIRQIGSGSIGATNVLRTGHKWLALMTMLLDTGKGALAVLLAGTYGPDMAVLAGGGAILGHIFPVWLKFRGGKGVATGFGILAAIDPLLGLAIFPIWLAIVALFRYVSLASILACLAAPFLAYWLVDMQHAELAGFLATLIILRHAGNILRLLRGKESRISFSRKSGGTDADAGA